MLLFVDSIFINDSDEFEKLFVTRNALAHTFKKTNTNVTEQLPSKCFNADFSRTLNFEPWRRKLVLCSAV